MKCKNYGMIRMICAVAIFFAALVLYSADVHAAAPTATGTVNPSDGVYVRASYSTSSSIVGGLSYGTTVKVRKEKHTSSSSTASTTKWYYVECSTATGWVRADLLDMTYKSVEGKAKGTVNIRSGPSTSFSKVGGTYTDGQTVKVIMTVTSAKGETWYKVYRNGYYNRYVYASYISMDGTLNNTNFENEVAAFPSSYRPYLRELHEAYPTWHFKPKNMSYSWADALNAQCENYKANTIPTSKPDSYKAVAKGTYNFDTHTYIGLDGSNWVAASRAAVAFYMDPRNWLDKINVFMFESLSYNPTTQKEAMVKDILEATAIPTSYSSSYMKGAADYGISAVYLAAKSRIELGNKDDMIKGQKVTNSAGKTYPAYNAYNIGAYDGPSGGAGNGLLYAVNGTTYLRPWNTLDKAIRGGAMYIAESFIGNNQHTLYYERFNVANGLSSIGTHQYMTNTMAAATQANITYWNYKDSDMLDTAFTFEIPVYKNMTSSPADMPGSGNNNGYLDSITVYDGNIKLAYSPSFNRFTGIYTLDSSVGSNVDKLTIKTETNAFDAKVSVTGNTNLKAGSNKISITVTSSAGVKKYYTLDVKKKSGPAISTPQVTGGNSAASGKPKLSWNAVSGASKYEIYRSPYRDGTYTKMYTTTSTTYTNTSANSGYTYYYKVKAVAASAEKSDSSYSSVVMRTCDLPQPNVTAGNRASDGKPKLTWKAIEGASKYEVYRSNYENGTYQKMYTTTGTSYINTLANSGYTYYYKVKAISKATSSANSAYSSVVMRTCDLPQPQVTGGNRPSDGKPQMTWKAVEGASKYEIYRADSKNGTYEKMYSTTGTVYTNTLANSGYSYYYKVKAISSATSSANSASSTAVMRTCDLPRPEVTAGNSASSGKPQLTWKTVKGASKYEIYRSGYRDGTYTKMHTTTSTSYTNTSANSGYTYYYKVKAISSATSAANSAYSLVKSATCK